MSTTALITTAVLVVIAAMALGAARDRWRYRRDGHTTVADEYLASSGPPATASPYRTSTGLTAAIAMAAIGAAIAAGAGLGITNSQSTSNRSSAALANLNRCNTIVGANWRRAVDVFLLGYSVTSPSELRTISAELGLPDDPGAVKAEGRARIVASLADDARLDAIEHRLCPFVPGDPSKTPDTPVGSATAGLNADLEHRTRADHGTPATLPHAPDTTTTTQPGAHP